MERNPYAPPTATVADIAVLPEGTALASRGRRFANLLLDSVFSSLISGIVSFFIALITGPEWVGDTLNSIVLAIVVTLLYYVPTETAYGWTLAKLVTGTRVISHKGERPELRQIVGRTFARFIPFEAFSFLAADRPVGWHDRFSGTRVIYIRG